MRVIKELGLIGGGSGSATEAYVEEKMNLTFDAAEVGNGTTMQLVMEIRLASERAVLYCVLTARDRERSNIEFALPLIAGLSQTLEWAKRAVLARRIRFLLADWSAR